MYPVDFSPTEYIHTSLRVCLFTALTYRHICSLSVARVCLQGLHQWQRACAPFTPPLTPGQPHLMRADSPGFKQLLSTLGSAQRGLLVIAELTTAEDAVAALAISKALGWPIVADALSGGSFSPGYTATAISWNQAGIGPCCRHVTGSKLANCG